MSWYLRPSILGYFDGIDYYPISEFLESALKNILITIEMETYEEFKKIIL